jgi:MYXO-CTERM domain-containing protein
VANKRICSCSTADERPDPPSAAWLQLLWVSDGDVSPRNLMQACKQLSDARATPVCKFEILM